MAKIDFNFALSDLDKFFQVVELLEDRDGLTDKFRPQVLNYLNKAKYFKPGIGQKAHKDAFPNMILSLIRREIMESLDLSPEDILLVTDKSFVDMLTDGYFFNENNYLIEGDTNESTD